ncbi:MAG: hypothetical protein HY779_06395 [Rubrobacteridae bacterium]|nr:hypothetical protein [Rubrobacteridae bacterium]
MCGCVLAIFALGAPRLVFLILWFFTNFFNNVFHSFIWPFLGFLFLPLTTLAYAWSMNTYHGVHGWGLAALLLGFAIDIGAIGGGSASKNRYRH